MSSDQPESSAPASEDHPDEHTLLMRSLLRERLKKQCILETRNYIQMKFYLLSEQNEETQEKVEDQGIFHRLIKSEDVIQPDEIFKPCPITNKNVRTVMLKGLSGIGKTTAVMKIVLDWAEGRTLQDIDFVLPLDLTSLNLEKMKKCSLTQLLGLIFPELRDIEVLKRTKVLFVLDGLSECGLGLKGKDNKPCGDPTKELPVGYLLVNLLLGDLFPKAQIWACVEEESLIPSKYVQRVVEIQGLDDVQWEEYFRSLIDDQDVAGRAIIHVKASSSLYFMRSFPAFCQVAARVLEELIRNGEEPPLTLTEMYSHYLARETFSGKAEANLKSLNTEDVLKLGKLAWHCLEKGTVKVSEADLKGNGIDPTVAAELSRRWSAVFKEKEPVYRFTHQTVQAYLSALYVVVHYGPTKGHVLRFTLAKIVQHLLTALKVSPEFVMHKRAVDKALKCKDGKLNYFLIFLLGLSVGPSRKLLSTFLSSSWQTVSSEESASYILKKIIKSPSLDALTNLIHCLDEMDVSYSVRKGLPGLVWQKAFQEDHTSTGWFTLARDLLNSEKQGRIVDIRDYSNPDVAFMRLLAVIKSSRVLRLCECTNLTWALLACALRSPCNSIREIDIEDHTIMQNSTLLIAEGLKSPNCKVEVLRTRGHICGRGDPLASAFLLNPSHLRELTISNCYVTTQTVEMLARILVDPGCHLEKLCLSLNTELSDGSCEILAAALKSSSCCLKELDLTNIFFNCGDKAVVKLSKGLENKNCQIQKLSLASCELHSEGFSALISAFSSNPSHLRELDLSYSRASLKAFQQLCSLLKDPHFRLQTLILVRCDWAEDSPRSAATDQNDKSCKALASALSSSSLRVLDLSMISLGDSSVELLSAGLGNAGCKLETLRMKYCNITQVGAATLAHALRSNPSHMWELDLSYNRVEGAGFDLLSSLVEDPGIKLERLVVHGLGEHRTIEELRQYDFPLTLDPNTASINVKVFKKDKYGWCVDAALLKDSKNPERFEALSQVMCREELTGRHFCQVEWFRNYATIGVAYKDMRRKGCSAACTPGNNQKSWALLVSTPFPSCQAFHGGVTTRIPDCSPWRVGVYVDWPAGVLSFYDITHDEARLIHTFCSSFTRPLHLVFNMSAGIHLLPTNPHPVCMHDHDPWGMFQENKDCKGCNGSKARGWWRWYLYHALH